jgi:hypothetical protein
MLGSASHREVLFHLLFTKSVTEKCPGFILDFCLWLEVHTHLCPALMSDSPPLIIPRVFPPSLRFIAGDHGGAELSERDDRPSPGRETIDTQSDLYYSYKGTTPQAHSHR